jgi:hypothetical protein
LENGIAKVVGDFNLYVIIYIFKMVCDRSMDDTVRILGHQRFEVIFYNSVKLGFLNFVNY